MIAKNPIYKRLIQKERYSRYFVRFAWLVVQAARAVDEFRYRGHLLETSLHLFFLGRAIVLRIRETRVCRPDEEKPGCQRPHNRLFQLFNDSCEVFSR